MKLNYSETKTAKLWIENGIVFIRCQDNAIITRREAENITNERIKISKGNSYPVCMDIRNSKYITMDARNYLKQNEGMQFANAYAFLLDSHVHNVIVNYFLTINPPTYPAMPTNRKENAISWLAGYKTKVKTYSDKELVA